MKVIRLTTANPAEHMACLSGWQQADTVALHGAIIEALPELEPRLNRGHIVYFCNGPAVLVRVEPTRMLLGFWGGQRLRHIEPRLHPGGKHEMATLEIKQRTALPRETVISLSREAVKLNRLAANPQAAAGSRLPRRPGRP